MLNHHKHLCTVKNKMDCFQTIERKVKNMSKKENIGNDDYKNMYSSFFSNAVEQLLKGAESKLGGDGIGWILGILNSGANDSQLDKMETELDTINSKLTEVINMLSSLAKTLALDINKVETYIAGVNAQDAISKIKTHYGPSGKGQGSINTLKYFSCLRKKDVDSSIKSEIKTFTNNVNGAWDIEDQIQKIHDAIISKDIGSTNGLLDLWTENFILTGSASGDKLMNYYHTLEKYFSILLFYQFQGANILVEAFNYKSVSNTENTDSGDSALSYLKGTFMPFISQQTDRFLKMVVKLIAFNCDLYSEERFLPDVAQEIMQRARFFIMQTLGVKDFGLVMDILGTKNLVDDIGGFIVTPDDIHSYLVVGKQIEVTLEDRPYDCWGTGASIDYSVLKNDNVYSLYYDHYTKDKNGPYIIAFWKDKGFKDCGEIGKAIQKKYNENYEEDENGKILYAYILKGYRIGGKEAMMNSSSFVLGYKRNDHDGKVEHSHSESLKDDVLKLSIKGNDEYTNTSTDVDMKYEYRHKFKYEGDNKKRAYINMKGKVTGSLFKHIENISADCGIAYRIGIYDSTNDEIVKRIDKKYTPDDIDKTRNISDKIDKQISFILNKGTHYYAYANIAGNGSNYSGDYKFDIEMKLTHLSLTFIDTEF